MMLTIAFIAVLGETATDLLAPWPLKVVFDYVLATKPMPRWMSDMFSSTVGLSKMAILKVAVFSLIIIAVVGAISTYVEKYFTTSVGQWVMHDLRRALYHHIQTFVSLLS
jgi:subfamily B ATP-binding cassette protein MsbA